LLKGDVRKALSEPASIVLTESFAHELFGDQDPFGETLNIGASGNTFPLKITGILQRPSIQHRFQIRILDSISFCRQSTRWLGARIGETIWLQRM